MTFPAAQRVVSLKGYSLASILPWDSLGLRPAIQSVRYAFAQAVRLATVTKVINDLAHGVESYPLRHVVITQHLAWNDTVRIRYLRQAFALSRIGTAKRTPVRLLLDQSLSITREDRHSEARGLPWECYGNALHYHRVTWNSIASALEC